MGSRENPLSKNGWEPSPPLYSAGILTATSFSIKGAKCVFVTPALNTRPHGFWIHSSYVLWEGARCSFLEPGVGRVCLLQTCTRSGPPPRSKETAPGTEVPGAAKSNLGVAKPGYKLRFTGSSLWVQPRRRRAARPPSPRSAKAPGAGIAQT